MQISPVDISNASGFTSQGNVSIGQGKENRLPGSKQEKIQGQGDQGRREHSRGSVDEMDVIRAIEHANNSFEGVFTQFEFSIHEKTKEIMVKILDRESGEVIREIPPEQILDMIAKMWELAGILVDERI